MKILFVWPICTFSVWDVARGYRHAFAKQVGEENIRDYYLNERTDYHRRALPPHARDNVNMARYASENVLNEALYFGADVVFIVSGLNFHPVALWSLRRVGVHAAAIMTESPYQDIDQADWVSVYPEMTVFTNEIASAEQYGWNYLPHAYDPQVHKHVESLPNDECDVLMVGTGWLERMRILEAVDWTGIDLRLYGIWPAMTKQSPLFKHLWPVCVDNRLMPQLYCGAKICLNIHRSGLGARSLNPRTYEVAACGSFQICDPRPELKEVFDLSIPSFSTSEELEKVIRYYLDNDGARNEAVVSSWVRVESHTFDKRAEQVLAILGHDIGQRKVA